MNGKKWKLIIMMNRERKYDSMRRKERWNESEIKITGQDKNTEKTEGKCTEKKEKSKGAVSNFSLYKLFVLL